MRKLITPFVAVVVLLVLSAMLRLIPARAAGPVPATHPAAAAGAPLPNGPVLTGEDGKPIAGIKLDKAQVQVVVESGLAQTTMTLTFRNELDRVLGGELVFPLPEGVTISGYGLEINGVMVDGVPVEKQRARIIYESELHKRVDPGLVEQVQGNTFKTRLYPVPAKGTRSVKVEYVLPVESAEDRSMLTLPVGWSGVIDAVDVKIDVRGSGKPPELAGRAGEAVKVEKSAGGYLIAGAVPTKDLGNGLAIALPPLPAQDVSVGWKQKKVISVEEFQEAAKGGDAAKKFGIAEHFFVVNDTPPVSKRQPAALQKQRVLVAWDASLSRASADTGRELKLLEQLLARLGNPDVDVAVLRDTVEMKPFFGPGADGTAKAMAFLQGLAYDGATNLGALSIPKNVSDLVAVKREYAEYGLALLFTDGLGNLGADMPKSAAVPVYAISNADQVNHALLRGYCQSSGGIYFNLKRAADEQVLAGVGDLPYTLVSVEANPEEVSAIYPTPGASVHGRFAIAGRLLKPEASIKVNYGFGKEITHSSTFTLKAEGSAEGMLLPRFWAQQKLAELSLFPEKNDRDLLRLGREFNLVTANTSLLVLENVDQYVQYSVVPPKSRPEIYEQFQTKIEQRAAVEQKSKEQKLQQVAVMWDQRVKWWEAEYKYPTNLKVKPEVVQTGAGRGGGGGGGAGLFGSSGGGNAAPTGQPPRTPAVRTPAPLPPADGAQRQQQQGQQPARPGAGVPDFTNAPDMDLNGVASPVFGSGGRKKGADESPSSRGPAIAIKTWDPKTPYIAAMKAVPAWKAYDAFLVQRKTFGKSPAFYLDSADFLVSIGQRSLGMRVLTDIAELNLQDARLLRVAAHRLMQIGERDLAIDLFEKVAKLRPEEPQSHRDLATALTERADLLLAGGNPSSLSLAKADYGRALELLNKVVIGDWPRFPEIELTALMEANRILAILARTPNLGEVPNPIDPRFRKNLDCDVRIVMTWDADQTDIDLWVTEPSDEKCFYGHNRTVIGGMLSRDFTDGYGPEEYNLRKLIAGQYKVQANYYGSRQQELTGPATVQATVITNFGRPNEKRQALTLRLKDAREVVDIGVVSLGDNIAKPNAAPKPDPAAKPAPKPAEPAQNGPDFNIRGNRK